MCLRLSWWRYNANSYVIVNLTFPVSTTAWRSEASLTSLMTSSPQCGRLLDVIAFRNDVVSSSPWRHMYIWCSPWRSLGTRPFTRDAPPITMTSPMTSSTWAMTTSDHWRNYIDYGCSRSTGRCVWYRRVRDFAFDWSRRTATCSLYWRIELIRGCSCRKRSGKNENIEYLMCKMEEHIEW